MTEEKPEIVYPEMLEYAWAKDLDRVYANSKYVQQDYSVGEIVTADKLPKSPINLVLAVIKEALTYPEVVEACKSGNISDNERERRCIYIYGSPST